MIREATVSDLERLMPICEEMHRLAQNKKFGLGYDLESAQGYVASFIFEGNRSCFIAEENGATVGTMGLICVPWYLNNHQKMVLEEWLYIDPIIRGGNLFSAFISLAEHWAKIQGAACLWMAALENNHRGIKKYYERKGFCFANSHFVKEVSNGTR